MDSTQSRLLQIAADLFAEKGYAAVSMRDIAAASGVTQAAIYHHFTGKDDLYFATVRRQFVDNLTPIIKKTNDQQSAEDKLSVLISSILQLAVDKPQFRRIYYRELLDGDKTRLLALGEDVLMVIHPVIDDIMLQLAPGTDSYLTLVSMLGMIMHQAEATKLQTLLAWSKPEHGELPVLAAHITQLLINGLKGQNTP